MRSTPERQQPLEVLRRVEHWVGMGNTASGIPKLSFENLLPQPERNSFSAQQHYMWEDIVRSASRRLLPTSLFGLRLGLAG